MSEGFVWLVGAGPGHPDLLTVRAVRVLETAEVVAYDELVSPRVLDLAPAGAERIAVGRRGGGVRHNTSPLDPRVVASARAGKRVVRLKGGDPYIFGRGGEEGAELTRAGIPFAVVPGITAALGAAASARIPLTLRQVSASVTLATAHEATDAASAARFVRTLPRAGTIVLYMGLAHIADLVGAFLAEAFPSETPIALVCRASLPDEHVIAGRLGTVLGLLSHDAPSSPAIIILGEVVGERPEELAHAVLDRLPLGAPMPQDARRAEGAR